MKRTIYLLFALLLLTILSLALSGCGGTSRGVTLPPPGGNGGGSGQTVQLQVTVTGGGTVASSPSGLTCNGQNCSGAFPVGTQVTLTATPASGASFTGWGGACSGTSATCALTLNGNQTATAAFATSQASAMQLQVAVTGTGSVVSSPAGINCPQACSASFPAGTQVVLTAGAPEDGTFTFAGWSGACTGNTICNVTMSSNQSVTASFTQAPLLQVSLTGSGTVTSNPPGINCGTNCSAPFATGTNVALTATPAAGWALQAWGGACSGSAGCSVAMNGAEAVTATFVQTQPQLHVTLSGTGTGVVTSSPQGINCGTACTASFAGGTSVTLNATPASGSSFGGWSGACSGLNACTVNLTGATDSVSVTANFYPNNGNTNGIQAVNHIIFMANENRGFDHYFGHLNDYRAGLGLPQEVDDEVAYQKTNGAAPSNPCHNATSTTTANCGWDGTSTIAANAEGTTNTLSAFHLKSMCVENPSPSWTESHVDWNINYTSDTPLLNGYVMEAAGDAINDGFHDIYGRRALGYYDGSDLNYYYYMATQFATSDRWFSPVMSRTHPNRMYLYAATSQGHAYPIHSGGAQLTAPTIFSALQKAGVSWKIYSDSYSYYQQFAESSTLLSGHLFPISQYKTDAQNGTLPQVAVIEPSQAGLDEHPGTHPDQPGPNIQYGANYVSGLINTLMQSPSWKDSVFIYTYDEAGGFYDHVAPITGPQEPNPDGISPNDLPSGDICTAGKMNNVNCNFNSSGYRVPMIVVSPFTKQHYVSHTPMDYTAWLKFVETRFNLAPLTKRDAAQPDMTEFFDFVNVPWATPPSPPPQNVTNSCYFTQFP